MRECLGEVGSQAKSQHIDCHAAQTDKGAAEIMTEKISNQINHVCKSVHCRKITKFKMEYTPKKPPINDIR